VEEEAQNALEALERLRGELMALVDADTDAYNKFGDAFAMPKGTDEEKAARRQAIRNAAKGAAQVPAQTLAASAKVARLIESLYRKTNRNCLSDAGTGMQLAYTAVIGAAMNVQINLSTTGDEQFNTEHAAIVADALAEITPLAETVTLDIRSLLAD